MAQNDHVQLPGSAEDIAYSSATNLVQMLRTKQIGSQELLGIYADRIDLLNKPLNAVIAFDWDVAKEAARAADRHLAEGEDAGALSGLPMTVKETFEMKGTRTSVGLPFLANHYATQDSVAVGRLRQQGAVIFGKTNIPIGGADHQTDNPIYGLTRNPWDLERTVGGSSGGAAAALSAGLTPLELGSDIGGSIRIPAHLCGVFGHKSSYGLVPTRGHIPPMPGTVGEAELAVAGPMARTARDLEFAMDILTGAGPEDPPASTTRMAPSRHEKLSDFRIALWGQDFTYATSEETRNAIATLAVELETAGARVSVSARPDFDPQASLDIYLNTLFSIVMAGQAFKLSADERAHLPADALHYGQILENCSGTSAESWAALTKARHALHMCWQDFFRDWDVLVCPVFPTTAFKHDLSGEGMGAQLHRRRQVDDQDVVYMSQLSWSSLATIGHLPSTVVPVPRLEGQLPLGLQIIGPYFEDRTTIRLASLLEEQLGYRTSRPPLDRTLARDVRQAAVAQG